MEAQLPASLALFSRHMAFDVIGYGCTSGATVIGSDKIEKIVHAQFPDAAVTDPIRSVIAACRALGVARMGMLTPYSLDVTQAMQARLEKSGIDVCSFASFNETYDHRVARITEQSVLDAIVKLNTDECDIIFASCTSLRCFNIIDTAEEQLNKPVISSNSAFAWHLHGLAGAAEVFDFDSPSFKIKDLTLYVLSCIRLLPSNSFYIYGGRLYLANTVSY